MAFAVGVSAVVANVGDKTMSVIDGSTNTVLGKPIPVGKGTQDGALVGMAVNPTTNRLYVVNGLDSTVSVIDGSTNAVLGSPIPVGGIAREIGVNPVTNRLYVANYADDTVSVIDGQP